MEQFNQEYSSNQCLDCGNHFSVTSWEAEFRKGSDFPIPSRCSHCRSRRRLLHLNQIHLKRRSCDATGKSILSHFGEGVRHPVYCSEYWHGDDWDARDYGREIDFSRPFFEQMRELKDAVPHVALHGDFARAENSEYTNFTGRLKNCYLVFNSNEDESCLYSYGLDSSNHCLDCLRVQDSELCYEAIDAVRCYNCAWVSQSEGCSDSYFLRNCIGCKNCFQCTNLSHKEYYYRNEPIGEAQFKQLVSQLGSWTGVQQCLFEFDEFRKDFPERAYYGVRNENVTGNYLVNSRNAIACFDSHDLWDGMYASQAFAKMSSFLDCDECGGGELFLESANSGPDAYNLRGCFACSFGVSDLTYCMECVHGCENLFGCISLRRSKFCILNKQYTEDEYKQLLPKVIEHMKSSGEWGEFLPPSLSDFPYNVTQAQVHHPTTREEVERLGFCWEEKVNDVAQTSDNKPPDSVDNISVVDRKEIFSCDSCSNGYRYQQYELEWHKKMSIALPRDCFFCRHKTRQKKRTMRRLFEISCSQCQKEVFSSYPAEYSQPVYCVDCFASSLV